MLESVGSDGPGPKRAYSTVAFPYTDLSEAEKLCERLFLNGGECRPEQLAAWLGHRTVESGAFRNKVASARLFGLVGGSRNVVGVTGLGKMILDQRTRRRARAVAFLSVPLYRELFESHRGGVLPPTLGLEHEMIRLGVVRTQVHAARRVFIRSAGQSGFFEVSRSRLVLPGGLDPGAPDPAGILQAGDSPLGAGIPSEPVAGPEPVPPASTYPKLIEAVLQEAPWGQGWTQEEFQRWSGLFIRAAAMHFKLQDLSLDPS